MKNIKTIAYLILFSFIVSGCQPGQLLGPTFTPTPTTTQTPSITPSSTPTLTLTPTPTNTNTPTNTPTVTFTPSPTVIGGAMIQFQGLDTIDMDSFCGLMTLDGEIIKKQTHFYDIYGMYYPEFEGANLISKYCPSLESNWVDSSLNWSPDHQHFVFYDHSWDPYDSLENTNLFLGKFTGTSIGHLGTFPFSKSNTGYIVAPKLFWVGNNHILTLSYSFETGEQTYTLIDIFQTKMVFQDVFRLNTQGLPFINPSIAPNGEKMIISEWSEEKNKFLHVDFVSGKSTSLESTLSMDSNVTLSTSIFFPDWSDDGSKFVIFGKNNNRTIPVVFDSEGGLLSVLDDESLPPFEGWASWKPDNESLIIRCNDNFNGLYDLCLINYLGEIEKVFPYQKFWTLNYWHQWSNDGKFLYYLQKPIFRAYPANFFRLNISDGTSEFLFDDLVDRTWISSDRIMEKYDFSAEWSPDGNWVILNNAGPTYQYLPSYGMSTSLICQLNGNCDQLKVDSIVIAGAKWWIEP